ncbi:MAG: 4-hydroxy-tetrahydrodipicolinate reductase [Pirellulaceae bacterium]|nr:4-hydroxy-tetrahydrodipicolinate reductase [Pirellulaceae bacterium]
MSQPLALAINGATGRVGKRLIALGHADSTLNLVAALEYPDHPQQGEDAGELAGIGNICLPISSELEESCQAAIDFSTPQGADSVLKECLERGIPLVLATTGLSDLQLQQIEEATERIPIVYSPNMSLAVNLTMKLAETAAQALANHTSGVDVEILERHHRYKEDAPSGTALKFGELISNKMGQNVETHGRNGRPGARPANEIGYHAIRTGDNPGEHTIVYGMLGETVELTVRASNRDCYALGALQAAKFAVKQAPGLYSMYDVLGI